MIENKETIKEENNNDIDTATKIFDKNIEEMLSGKEDVFEDLYSNSSENNDEIAQEEQEEVFPKEYNKKIKKQKKRMPVGLRILIILLVSFFFAACIILTAVEVEGIALSKPVTAEVVLEQGSTAEDIAQVLKDNKIINSTLLFRLYVKIKGGNDFKFGVHEVKSNQSYSSLIDTLSQNADPANSVKVTIPEGYSVKKIAKLMKKNNICSEKEFIMAVKYKDYDYDFVKEIPEGKCYYRLEGYLFPATYSFYVNPDKNKGDDNAYKAVNKMLQRMDEELTDDVKNTADKNGYSVHEILTMASIVEAEASGYPKEMKNVAQVFYNRLRWTDQPARLGSSPTANYPDSRYNTNSNIGLPPGPICSPSTSAIQAALNPNTSLKADYFVTDRNMKFYYTNSLSEHNALIEKLQSEGLWN